MADSSARLTVLNGPMAGKELVLEEVVDNILIGSDGACRFHLPVPGISPIHARIWMDAAGVTIYDTHSPRGLYVNDDRVNGQSPLRNGDVLWLGTPGEEEAVMIQVRLPPRGGAAATPAGPVAPAEAEPEAESTVVMSAPTVAEPESDSTVVMSAPAAAEPEPEALEVVEESATVSMPAPSLDAFTIAEPPAEAEADSTVVMEVGPEAVAEPAADATVVDFGTPVAPDETVIEETYAMPAMTEEPVKFAIDLPPAEVPEPPSFEDETTELPAAVEEPPPPPPVVAAPPPPPPPLPPPPPPVAARPAPAPAPAPPRAPRPAAAPTPPPARPLGGSKAGLFAALGGVGLLVVAGGGYAAWRMMQSPAAPPTGAPEPTMAAVATPAPIEAAPVTQPPIEQAAPPPIEPVPEPPVEEAVTIVKSPPPTTLAAAGTKPAATTAKPTAAPPPTTVSAAAVQAQQTASQVASQLGRADSLAASRDYAGAAAAYDEVLRLDPANAKATDGKASALAAVASLKKSFVSGRTSIQSGKAAKGGVSGFDSEDVSVAKAPDYSGRIDFESSPRNVKAGDNYTILAYLTNDGKKGFKIQAVAVNTVANGTRTAVPVSPRDKDLEPQQRVLLAELPGTWQAETKTWSVEVSVTSNRNDTFKNTLTWR